MEFGANDFLDFLDVGCLGFDVVWSSNDESDSKWSHIDGKDEFFLGELGNFENVNIASSELSLGEYLIVDCNKAGILRDDLDLLEGGDVLFDLIHVSLLLLPKSVGILVSNYYADEHHFLPSDKDELELSGPVVLDGSHPRELHLIQIETVLDIDKFIASLIDGIRVNVLFIESDLWLDRFAWGGEINETCLFCFNIVVDKGDVFFTLDLDVYLISEDAFKKLAFGAYYIVRLANFDGVFGNDWGCLFVALDFSFSLGLVLVLLVLDGVLELQEGLVHAELIAALVVDQHKAIRALSADVAVEVVLAAQDVDVADPTPEVVVVSAGRAQLGRRVHRQAGGRQGALRLRLCGVHQGEYNKKQGG